MKTQKLVSKGSLSRLFQEAAEAWRRQAYHETIGLLERASRLDPANVNIFLDLGRAHGLRYDYNAADQCFEKAVKFAPSKVAVLAEAGRRCQEFGQPEMASRYFGLAVKEKGASVEVLVTLAELCERAHRVSEAAVLVERALAMPGKDPRPLLSRSRLTRLLGDLEQAEALARQVLEMPSCDPQTRIRSWYELGAILDRQGRFDEAMTALLEAKALQRPAASRMAAVLEGIQARVKEQEQTISAAVLNRWAGARAELGPARPFAVLCGHPRSGTTLLEQVLDAHPSIVSAEETHILHDEAYLPLSQGFPVSASVLQILDAAAPSQLRQARENYFRFTELFIGTTIGEKLLIDKNPALNVLIPAVIRIFPEARFLVALRDPRDVCLSCFMQFLPLNPVSSAYLSIEGTSIQYASVMGFWRLMLSRMSNPSIEVWYEELVEDLGAVSHRVMDFLGIDWDDRVLRFHEHARNKPVRSPSYAEVTKPVFKTAVGRWRNYQQYLDPWLDKLRPFMR